jgi:hypothetical protein
VLERLRGIRATAYTACLPWDLTRIAATGPLPENTVRAWVNLYWRAAELEEQAADLRRYAAVHAVAHGAMAPQILKEVARNVIPAA